MRTRTTILIGALLLVSAGVARAQEPPASQAAAQPRRFRRSPRRRIGRPEDRSRWTSAFRGPTVVTGDEARYKRFRDLRQGGR